MDKNLKQEQNGYFPIFDFAKKKVQQGVQLQSIAPVHQLYSKSPDRLDNAHNQSKQRSRIIQARRGKKRL